MEHPIYRVTHFDKVGALTLRIYFDDNTIQTINFKPVLHGPLFGILKDENVFDKVSIDPEAHTLVWPNGVDFDPMTLHDWPKFENSMKKIVERSVENVIRH